MGELWATMLPAAIAIALSPTGIIELILVLFTVRARLNAFVFLTSVTVAVFLLPLLGASVLRAAVESETLTAAANTATAWALIGFGALMIPLAVANFLKRDETSRPAVLDEIARMGALAVFMLSLTVVWLNPINAVILLSVGSRAAATHVPIMALLPALAAFTVLATAPFFAVVVFLVAGGERATAALDRIRQRIVDHIRIITAVVLGLLGVLLIVQGIASVSS